ncbi:MAG: TIGR03435 family protein [Bryobacteraceae bacterium]|jgi:uncharacterized protein (TIGR03435 family)
MGKIVGLIVFMGAVFGQSFEVASVKMTQTPAPVTMAPAPGGERFVARNMPLLWLIGAAYSVPNRQVLGLPQAMLTGGYDIEAKAEHPVSRSEMMRMLQTLLEDRFKLVVRRETKEMKAQVLVVAKGGARVDENQDGAELAIRRVSGSRWSYHNMPMPTFANVLSAWVDDTVVDQTGLKGSYDITLDYMPERARQETAPDPNAPSLYTALQEQLGLRLESRKGPVEVLVVKHIGGLSGN